MYGPAFLTTGALFLIFSSYTWIGCTMMTIGCSLFIYRLYHVAFSKSSYDLIPAIAGL